MKNRYMILGVILTIAGLSVAVLFYYFLNSAALTATGLSAIILGLTSIFLSSEKSMVSPEAYRMMMQTGMENTTRLLEELKIKNKAIYVPRNMGDGHSQALMPLYGESSIQNMKDKLTGKLTIRNIPGSEGVAIAITTPGNISLDMLPKDPEPTADDIQASMTYILNRIIGETRRVKVDMEDSIINIEVKGTKIDYENTIYYQCLGSPIASIAAAVSSEALVKPVRIINENNDKGNREIILEVLN